MIRFQTHCQLNHYRLADLVTLIGQSGRQPFQRRQVSSTRPSPIRNARRKLHVAASATGDLGPVPQAHRPTQTSRRGPAPRREHPVGPGPVVDLLPDPVPIPLPDHSPIQVHVGMGCAPGRHVRLAPAVVPGRAWQTPLAAAVLVRLSVPLPPSTPDLPSQMYSVTLCRTRCDMIFTLDCRVRTTELKPRGGQA
jgi:hypothetical protein